MHELLPKRAGVKTISISQNGMPVSSDQYNCSIDYFMGEWEPIMHIHIKMCIHFKHDQHFVI